MNLNKLFNKNYFIENIKKSRGFFAVILCLVPLINFVVMLFLAIQKTNVDVIKQLELSVVTIICMFIVPIVVSACLFGFSFKKKSVDFIGSMPISKSSIFITNSIGGILILIALILMNSIIFLLFNLLTVNIVLPMGMIIDYFILWSITYIFVFTATNLAMSISGNLITQLIVTALLLFLIPFMYIHITTSFEIFSYKTIDITCKEESCVPNSYYCYEDEECNAKKLKGIYQTNLAAINNPEFTLPYQLISNMNGMYFNNNLYYPISLVKMTGLSIIYFMSGLFLFKKRKMEECETSFKSIHRHSIVKLLTMYPILAVLLIPDSYEQNPIIIVIALLISFGYFFIYDLVTKKGITEIRISFIYLASIIIFMFGFNIVLERINDNDISFLVSDIKEISIRDNYYNSFDNVNTNNKDIINQIIKYSLEAESYDYNHETHYLDYRIKLDNNKEYSGYFNANLTDYKKIMGALNADDKIINEYKDFAFDKVYAIGIGDYLSSSRKYSDLIELVKKQVEKTKIDDLINNTSYYDSVNITLYAYVDHGVKEVIVNTEYSDELVRYVANFYHDKAKEILKKKDIWYSVESVNYSVEKTFNVDEHRYLMQLEPDKFLNYIKDELNKKFDEKKPYIILYFLYDGFSLKLYTNNIDKYEKLIDETRKQYEKTVEYKEYMRYYNVDGSVKGWQE